jgi:hypothetical protein
MRIIFSLTSLIVCLLSHHIVSSSLSCKRASRRRRTAVNYSFFSRRWQCQQFCFYWGCYDCRLFARFPGNRSTEQGKQIFLNKLLILLVVGEWCICVDLKGLFFRLSAIEQDGQVSRVI